MRVIFIARLLGAIPGSTKCEDNNFAQSKSLLKFCEGGCSHPSRFWGTTPEPCSAAADVRYGPTADSCSAAKKGLFDHPIGTEKQAVGGSPIRHELALRAPGR